MLKETSDIYKLCKYITLRKKRKIKGEYKQNAYIRPQTREKLPKEAWNGWNFKSNVCVQGFILEIF